MRAALNRTVVSKQSSSVVVCQIRGSRLHGAAPFARVDFTGKNKPQASLSRNESYTERRPDQIRSDQIRGMVQNNSPDFRSTMFNS